MRLLTLVVLAVFSTQSVGAAPKTWENMSQSERLAATGKITRSCKLPPSTLRVRGEELRIHPPVNADYHRIDCVLDKTRVLLGAKKMGFVGNEAYYDETH